MKVIAYAIFIHNDRECHSFDGFMDMFPWTIRSARLLYPDWQIWVYLDTKVFDTKYADYFHALHDEGVIRIRMREHKSLCSSMLWRIQPVTDGVERFICRDADSLCTWRERQAVEQWIEDKTKAHTMNDSAGHGLPMCGGMLGFLGGCFEIKQFNPNEFHVKGSDQTYIAKNILPQVKDSITEHRISGWPVNKHNRFSREKIADIPLNLPIELKATNDLVNHIGQGGFFLDRTYNEGIDKLFHGAIPYFRDMKNEVCRTMLKLEKGLFRWA